ncbi:uncharacterized protein LOC135165129 [Diachasmimorpha longicaudata]|uniref:uncharacterized protein LOC135165129 n=1 Tax=Diachasmimorpha longicaudata TaxID=58733 RepID=UPI0030B8CFFF
MKFFVAGLLLSLVQLSMQKARLVGDCSKFPAKVNALSRMCCELDCEGDQLKINRCAPDPCPPGTFSVGLRLGDLKKGIFPDCCSKPICGPKVRPRPKIIPTPPIEHDDVDLGDDDDDDDNDSDDDSDDSDDSDEK